MNTAKSQALKKAKDSPLWKRSGYSSQKSWGMAQSRMKQERGNRISLDEAADKGFFKTKSKNHRDSMSPTRNEAKHGETIKASDLARRMGISFTQL